MVGPRDDPGPSATSPSGRRTSAPAPWIVREGSVRGVGEILDSLGARRVFCVLDDDAYVRSGAAEALAGALDGRVAGRFGGFAPNPRLEDVVRGVDAFRRSSADAVLAVGGGTALDLAKAIGTCGVQSAAARDLVVGAATFAVDGPPMIAVPTTAGTGSEATHFAVVYVGEVKYSVAHPFLRPDRAVLDPTLTYSLPPGLSAATGLDALCQGIESLWAVRSSPESIADGGAAARLALANVELAVLDPTPAARRAMMRAALLSGRAIDVGTTTAAHATSYAITSRFGVPHGIAVALALGPWLEYNAGVDDGTCADPRGTAHVRGRVRDAIELLGATTARGARERLDALLRRLGCPARLSEVGAAEGDLAPLRDAVNVERLANNPRSITAAGLLGLLEGVL